MVVRMTLMIKVILVVGNLHAAWRRTLLRNGGAIAEDDFFS